MAPKQKQNSTVKSAPSSKPINGADGAKGSTSVAVSISDAPSIPNSELNCDFRTPEGKTPLEAGYIAVPRSWTNPKQVAHARSIKKEPSSKTLCPAGAQSKGVRGGDSGTVQVESFEALASALSDEAKESVFFLWYEVYGNPKGVPAVHVHGGPGYHSDYDDRCFFNPSLFKVILFDQRGCGHSIPRLSKRCDFGLFEATTLNDTIQDMEEVRRQLLGKESWVVLGVSWGSALSLMYAEHFPNRVSSLILQGVYTGHISEHRPLVDGARLNSEHREAWNCLRDALLPPQLDEIVNLRKATGTDHHGAKISTDEKSSPNEQVVELPTEEALWRDPIKLHDHARWLIQSPLVPDNVANCVLGVWEMFENYMTYPEDRAHYLKEMINALKLSGIRSEANVEGSSNSTSTSASRAWTPSPTDVSQTAFQVILFPQMMKLDPPIASETVVKKIGLQTPVTIVHGTGDDVCPVAAADTLYRSLLAARTSSNSGTGNGKGKKGGTSSGDSTSTKGKKGVQYMRITGAAHSSSSLQTNHWLVEATNAAWEHAFGDDDS